MTQAADEKIPFHRNWHELIKPEKLEVDKEKHTETYGKFICQPLERGLPLRSETRCEGSFSLRFRAQLLRL